MCDGCYDILVDFGNFKFIIKFNFEKVMWNFFNEKIFIFLLSKDILSLNDYYWGEW